MAYEDLVMRNCESYPLYTPPEDYSACWMFGGGKGGTVKTTSCIHSAIVMARTGKTLVVDVDPDSQSAAKWTIGYQAMTGKEAPFTVMQHTIPEGLAQAVRRMRKEGGFKHVLIDVSGSAGPLFRQALRIHNDDEERTSELILPISPSTIETVTLGGVLRAAEEVAEEQERSIGAQIVWCRNDTRTNELADAVATADAPENDWPYLNTVVPSRLRYRNFGTLPEHVGSYEGVVKEIVEGSMAA
ncbi:hypothetical protein SUDANB95_07949 (plasmid) [Actinosynnema sp. ALI-1.44]